jgi:hypothetical protein
MTRTLVLVEQGEKLMQYYTNGFWCDEKSFYDVFKNFLEITSEQFQLRLCERHFSPCNYSFYDAVVVDFIYYVSIDYTSKRVNRIGEFKMFIHGEKKWEIEEENMEYYRIRRGIF